MDVCVFEDVYVRSWMALMVKSAARIDSGEEHSETHRQVSTHTRISIHRHDISSIKIGLSRLHFDLHTKWEGYASMICQGDGDLGWGGSKTSSSLSLYKILLITNKVLMNIL